MLVNLMLSNSLIYVIGVFLVLGILSKIVVGMTLHRLVKSASNMSKSQHKFMKLVKAKFEHASMANNGVDNVPIFVDKYIHEYKTLGMTLHSWQKIQKISIGMVVISGAAGSVLAWYLGFGSTTVLQYAIGGISTTIILMATYQVVDENHRIMGLRIYMVDYLANVLANRYEKSKEKNRMQNMLQNTPEMEQENMEVDRKSQAKNLPELSTKEYVDNFATNQESFRENVDNFETNIVPNVEIKSKFKGENQIKSEDQEEEKIVVTNTGFGWQAEAEKNPEKGHQNISEKISLGDTISEASYTGVTAEDAANILGNRIQTVKSVQSANTLESIRKEVEGPKFHIQTLEEENLGPKLTAMEKMLQDEAQKRTIAKEQTGVKSTVDSAMIRQILEEYMA